MYWAAIDPLQEYATGSHGSPPGARIFADQPFCLTLMARRQPLPSEHRDADLAISASAPDLSVQLPQICSALSCGEEQIIEK